MTHKQYTEQNEISQRTAAYRFVQCGVGAYSSNNELTPEQLDALANRFGGAQKAVPQNARNIAQKPARVSVLNKKTATVACIAGDAKAAPQKAAQNTQGKPEKNSANNAEGIILFYSPFAVTLVSIALTCCGLFMFAGWYGAGLGSMFGLFLFSAALVARNAEKGDTSEAALKTVLHLELGACLLHPFTFYHSFLKMGVSGEWWVLVGAAAVCSGFVALISYNAVMLIRNYNAER